MKTSVLLVALGAASILGASLSGQQPPAATAPLSLQDAMTAALAANPALAAARLGRDEARARGDVARQRPNPELAIEEARDFPRDSATLSLPIERGGKRERRIAVASAQARSNEAEIARLTATTRNQVRRAYFALAAAERRGDDTGQIRGPAE